MSQSLVSITEDIIQLRLPLPFALNSVNVYLVRGVDGWTVVDTGIHTTEAEAVWQAAFVGLNLPARAIQQIILTHAHPDHYGMAGWLQYGCAQAGAIVPVRASPREAAFARTAWQVDGYYDLFIDFFNACGMPAEKVKTVADGFSLTRHMTFPHPTELVPLEPGSTLQMGQRQFTAIHAPGHSDGQLMFYDADDRLLLCGDHVLMKITPNIGLWLDTDPEPLARFLASLRELQTLDVRLALPGHKALITDWRGRVTELIAHHAARLEKTFAACTQPATVYEVSQRLFDMGQFSDHEWRFAMVEARAHLDYLAREGRLCLDTDSRGVWRYQQA